jgi:hypothetical protein
MDGIVSGYAQLWDDPCATRIKYLNRMDADRNIYEIEWLERIYELPDARPLKLADREAANQKHDEVNAENPWFRLWKRYGV